MVFVFEYCRIFNIATFVIRRMGMVDDKKAHAIEMNEFSKRKQALGVTENIVKLNCWCKSNGFA